MGVERKVIIGLTGSVGSGKTTVTRQFERLGCAGISADKLDREILGQPGVIAQIESWWGRHILNGQGRVDRDALGRIILNDNAQLKKLVTLVHPLIKQREQELIERYQQDQTVKAIVLEVPFLFESGKQKDCDVVVLVLADKAVRWQRITQKRGWDSEKIKRVEKFHAASDIKEKMSDHILRNNSTISDLNDQVAELFPLILQNVKAT